MLFFFCGFIRMRKEKMKLSEYLKIGTKMKILRKEKGISQKEMAEILGMIPSAYSNYENHFTDIPVEIMKKFCNIVGCSMNELIGFDVSTSEEVHPIFSISDLMLVIMDLNKKKLPSHTFLLFCIRFFLYLLLISCGKSACCFLTDLLLVVDRFQDCRMISAYCTVMSILRQFNLMEFHCQRIKSQKISCQKITYTNQILDCFHCL